MELALVEDPLCVTFELLCRFQMRESKGNPWCEGVFPRAHGACGEAGPCPRAFIQGSPLPAQLLEPPVK